jgi:hypothetical protein
MRHSARPRRVFRPPSPGAPMSTIVSSELTTALRRRTARRPRRARPPVVVGRLQQGVRSAGGDPRDRRLPGPARRDGPHRGVAPPVARGRRRDPPYPGLFVRFAGIATAALASAFIVALVQAKARGLAIDCGCFGGGGTGDGVTWLDIARDIPIVLAGIYLARRPVGPLQLDNLLGVMEDHDGEDRGSNQTRTSTRTG